MEEDTAGEMKARAPHVWASGDYPSMAQRIQEAADELVEATGPGAGQRVLDIATGSGNVAIRAAERGAEVVGSDITAPLLEAARARAADAGVEIDWVEADAERLPFEDGEFDFVLSTFGIMFAPRHEVAAAEAARVCAPGGTIGICSWTPTGRIGEFFKVIAGHMPPPPPGFVPPPAWGTEEHVREIFGDAPIDWTFEVKIVTQRFESAENMVETFERDFGPVIVARALLEPQGKWQALHEDYLAFAERMTRPLEGGGVGSDGEYLMAIGRKRG